MQFLHHFLAELNTKADQDLKQTLFFYVWRQETVFLSEESEVNLKQKKTEPVYRGLQLHRNYKYVKKENAQP